MPSNRQDPDHLAAVETRPYLSGDDDIAIASAITRRRSDRRRYSSWEVPGWHLELMARRAARAGALLVPVLDSGSRWLLTRAIDRAARHRDENRAYRLELAAWSGRSRGAVDGVLTASGAGFPNWHDDTFPGCSSRDAATGRGEPDSGRLLVVATLDDDPGSVLRAGEAASAALLTATGLGLATCPLSQPLEITETRAAIRDEVLDGGAFPQLILRAGWTPASAPPLPASPVHRTAETVARPPGTTRGSRATGDAHRPST